MIPISNLLVKQSKIVTMTVQMAIEKLVYGCIEQLLFGILEYQRRCNDSLACQSSGFYWNHLDNSK